MGRREVELQVSEVAAEATPRPGTMQLSPAALLAKLIIALITASWMLSAVGTNLAAWWRRSHPLHVWFLAAAGVALGFLGSYLWLGLPPGDTLLLLILLACAPFDDRQFFRF